MNKFKYVLLIFNDFGSNLGQLKEKDALNKIAMESSKVSGISCGAINITTFESVMEKNEISRLLEKDDLKYFLFDEKDSKHSLPDFVQDAIDLIPKKIARTSAVKLSLEDQLEEAVKEQDFMMAARIRDKIQNKTSKV